MWQGGPVLNCYQNTFHLGLKKYPTCINTPPPKFPSNMWLCTLSQGNIFIITYNWPHTVGMRITRIPNLLLIWWCSRNIHEKRRINYRNQPCNAMLASLFFWLHMQTNPGIILNSISSTQFPWRSLSKGTLRRSQSSQRRLIQPTLPS